MASYKLVMVGCHESGYHIIKYLLNNGISFEYFVTLPPDIAKLHNVSGYVSFNDLAEQYDIPVYYVNSYALDDEEDQQFFEDQNFDLLIQGGWQRLFPEKVLDSLQIGAIGGHGSSEFLPKGRGRSPLNWCLIEGRDRFIMQYFLIKPGIDDGDIFYYEMFDINRWDDINTLYYKIAIITSRVLLTYIPRLLNKDVNFRPQEGEPTYYPKRTEEDGRIDWGRNYIEVYNFIRAQTHPYPGAYSYLDGEKVKIWKAQPFDTRLDLPGQQSGEVVRLFDGGDFVVKCQGGLLLVREYSDAEVTTGDVFSGI